MSFSVEAYVLYGGRHTPPADMRAVLREHDELSEGDDIVVARLRRCEIGLTAFVLSLCQHMTRSCHAARLKVGPLVTSEMLVNLPSIDQQTSMTDNYSPPSCCIRPERL